MGYPQEVEAQQEKTDSPNRHSVNDVVEKELTSMNYVSVDDVVSQVWQLGRGTMIAKMDVKSGYRNIPVLPKDKHMKRAGYTYVDLTLPFRLHSVPLIFSAVTDVLARIMQLKKVLWLAHYLSQQGPQEVNSVREMLG